MNSHPPKRPPSEHIPNPLLEESLRKCPYSHIGHQEEPKDGMSSDAVEGEPIHLEANPIFFPSMATLDVLFEPIFQHILDPNESSYALS
jgi:hypothetical protein